MKNKKKIGYKTYDNEDQNQLKNEREDKKIMWIEDILILRLEVATWGSDHNFTLSVTTVSKTILNLVNMDLS